MCIRDSFLGVLIFFAMCEKDVHGSCLVRWVGWTQGLYNIVKLWGDPDFTSACFSTVQIVLVSTTIMVTLSYVAAWMLVTQSKIVQVSFIIALCWSAFVPSLFVCYPVLLAYDKLIALCSADHTQYFPTPSYEEITHNIETPY